MSRRWALLLVWVLVPALALGAGLMLRGELPWQRGGEVRTLRVLVLSNAVQVELPGTREARCLSVPSLGTCAPVVRVEHPAEGPFRVRTTGVVSPGTRLLYWGCGTGWQTGACKAENIRPEALVCVTTSNTSDNAYRSACVESGPQAKSSEASGRTKIATFVPVTREGRPAPGYVVVDHTKELPLESCDSAYSAVAPDIVTCLPNVLSAHACWVAPDRSTALCGGPGSNILRRHEIAAPLPRIAPPPAERRWPLGIELLDGTMCTRRMGGPAPPLPAPWVSWYGCGKHGQLVTRASVADPPNGIFDRSGPNWTVQTIAQGAPVSQKVAAVHYAGRP